MLEKLLQARLVTVTHNNRDLGSALIGAAQEAQKVITKKVIQASFRDTGVYPFNGELILENSAKNVGMVEKLKDNDTGVAEQARKMTMDTINDSLGATKSKRVRVRPKKLTLFSGEQMVEEVVKTRKLEKTEKEAKKRDKLEKEEQKERAKKVRIERKENHICRGPSHNGTKTPCWNGSKQWVWCESCDSYGLCPKCVRSGAEFLKEHEDECAGKN